MRAIRIFGRNINNALKNITRNASLSAASIICTTITLTIVAIALLFSANINDYTKSLEEKLDIIVYVDKDATEEDISTVKSKILDIKSVKSDELVYKSKNDIKEEMLKSYEEGTAMHKLISSWTEKTNPLMPEFTVTVKNIEDVKTTAETLEKIENVSTVQYREDVLEKLVPVIGVVEKVTLIIIIGLIVVTVFLICNTIKLTIFARKNEIEIMRLVGTSNFVIKLPFVIEGLFLGFIGSIIPIVVTIWGYILSYDKLEGHLFVNTISMIDPMPLVLMVSVVVLGLGCLVGMFGSYTTVRKYLKI